MIKPTIETLKEFKESLDLLTFMDFNTPEILEELGRIRIKIGDIMTIIKPARKPLLI